VLDDDLLDAIKSGLNNNEVICVAGKLSTSPVNWLKHYEDFVAKLQSHKIPVKALVAPNRNWHAKIAIRLCPMGKPVVAIVGSSNLTGPAYGENRYAWNYECDVTLWKDKPLWDSVVATDQDQQSPDDVFTTMSVVLDSNVNQPSIEDRLAVLLEDINREQETFMSLSDYGKTIR